MRSEQPEPDGTFANAPSAEDKRKIREFLDWMPFRKRLKPVAKEMNWVLLGRQNPTEHKKLLPDYCYEILDIKRRTVFKNMPPLDEIIRVSDKDRLAKCKTPDEAKQFLTINFRLYGRMTGIGVRGVRLIELEAVPKLKREGLLDLKPEQEKTVLGILFGNEWLKLKLARFVLRPGDMINRLVCAEELRPMFRLSPSHLTAGVLWAECEAVFGCQRSSVG